mgnify:CR=1 FL=1
MNFIVTVYKEIGMFYIDYSWRLALISIITFIIMLIMSKPIRTYCSPQSNNVYCGMNIFFLLYTSTCIFAFWEYDTYHYWNNFLEAKSYGYYEITGYEAVYNWLAGICQNNYFLWRTFIFLPACLFLYYSVKRLELLQRNMLVALILFGAMLSYTRGMLGHAMLLYGAILIVDDRSSSKAKFVGLIFICVSYFFHKSMYVNIAFVLLAFCHFNKRLFVLSLIAFPFLTLVATSLVDHIASGAMDISFGEGVGGAGDRTLDYVSKGRMESNIIGTFVKVFILAPQYLTLFYLSNRVLYKKCFIGLKDEKVFTYLYKLTYVAIYIASLFAFVETSNWIYERFKYMGFFPLPFVLAKVWSLEKKTNKWIKWIILLQMFCLFYTWIYRLYKWY